MDIAKVMTPYKLGRPVIAPSGQAGAFDEKAVDIPFVFRHDGKFCMMYTGYDGHGYQTALAHSENLLDWDFAGMMLVRGGAGWDRIGAAGTWILREDGLGGSGALKRVDGKYWMVYHAYPQSGYEEGPAEIGIAWCEEEGLLHWHRLEAPVFSWKEGGAWERGGLYKACLIEQAGQYYLFYNAKNVPTVGTPWAEQIGLATSPDLLRWERRPDNPILRVTPNAWDARFVADPWVVQDVGRWLAFYYGFDNRNAQEGLAWAGQLEGPWKKYPAPILRHGAKGTLDEIHAHKPAIIRHDDILYHFYCAVRPWRPGDSARSDGDEFRCITVATSSPMR